MIPPTLPLVALAYFALAGLLPDAGSSDGALIAYCGVGVLAATVVALCVAWAAAGPEVPSWLVALLLAGTALIVAVLDASGVGSGATTAEALGAGALGVLVARALLQSIGPLSVVVIPVFVAIVDALSVAFGPTSRLTHGHPRGAAELSMDLPSWGHALAGPAGRLGLPDALFVSLFWVCAIRLRLRVWPSAAGMLLGLLATAVLSITTDRTLPALPLIAVGFLVPNVDRLRKPATSHPGVPDLDPAIRAQRQEPHGGGG